MGVELWKPASSTRCLRVKAVAVSATGRYSEWSCQWRAQVRLGRALGTPSSVYIVGILQGARLNRRVSRVNVCLTFGSEHFIVK